MAVCNKCKEEKSAIIGGICCYCVFTAEDLRVSKAGLRWIDQGDPQIPTPQDYVKY